MRNIIAQFTRRELLLCGSLVVIVALHIASLCVFVRFFAPSFVCEFARGFVTVYWGGGAEFRNSCVLNAAEWPLRAETHFAGTYLAEGQKWEAYAPDPELAHLRWFSDRIHYRGVFRAFGFSLPQLRHEDDASSMIIPLGTVAFIAELGALLFAFKAIPDKLHRDFQPRFPGLSKP